MVLHCDACWVGIHGRLPIVGHTNWNMVGSACYGSARWRLVVLGREPSSCCGGAGMYGSVVHEFVYFRLCIHTTVGNLKKKRRLSSNYTLNWVPNKEGSQSCVHGFLRGLGFTFGLKP